MKFILAFGLWLILFLGFILSDELPIVHQSWPDQECIRIEVRGQEKACPEQLPEKYTVIWVKKP